MIRSVLPVDACLEDLLDQLQRHPCVLLQAPPGAGKTTRVPPALLAAPWVGAGRILMLEPRRLAARAAAHFMAKAAGETVGARIGYRVRFDSRVSRHTRIEVVTEGVLIRQLQRDPELAGVAVVIFDEFHERSLHADLALALCRETRQALRPDLRLLIMSATLDSDALAACLEAPRVVASGQSFPVRIEHHRGATLAALPARMAVAVCDVLAAPGGDVLAFLPGGAEIAGTRALLEGHPACSRVVIHSLHGDLPLDVQQRAIDPDPRGRRKVILTTPVAETSLTVNGVDTVIDSGLRRAPRFDPNTGLTRLVTERVSRDSADQRAGRAGRLGPGRCLRLWSEADHRDLAAHRKAEILNADLAALALELAAWGVTDANALPWLDPPPRGPLAQARDLLSLLGALDGDGRITARGRAMAELPVHPRLAHMLVVAGERHQTESACLLAALLENRDPMGPDAGADLDHRLDTLRRQDLDPERGGPLAGILRAAAQLRRLLPGASDSTPAHAGPVLIQAYPDRIARRRDGSRTRYRLANGRGARLRDEDPLAGCDWLVAASVDGGRVEGRIHLAAAIDHAELAARCAAWIRVHDLVAWDCDEQAVVARRERRIGALVFDTRSLPEANAAARAQAMLQGVRMLGLKALPWTPALRQWQARVMTLRHLRPDEGWPDVSDGGLESRLEDWLAPFLAGCSRRSHLQRVDLAAALDTQLPYPLAARLRAEAPTLLTVPSGSRIALRYQTDGSPPVLAVKLQELFGLAETPRIANGQIPVLLHLLSPARRPIQVTGDLRGFWDRTYPEVRRELKGRYPKHPWPEDPWNATPTARTGPRGDP